MQNEEDASLDLTLLAGRALKFEGVCERAYLKKLWGEPWLSIKAKLQVEGSCWYVWWMDGVRQHLANQALPYLVID